MCECVCVAGWLDGRLRGRRSAGLQNGRSAGTGGARGAEGRRTRGDGQRDARAAQRPLRRLGRPRVALHLAEHRREGVLHFRDRQQKARRALPPAASRRLGATPATTASRTAARAEAESELLLELRGRGLLGASEDVRLCAVLVAQLVDLWGRVGVFQVRVRVRLGFGLNGRGRARRWRVGVAAHFGGALGVHQAFTAGLRWPLGATLPAPPPHARPAQPKAQKAPKHTNKPHHHTKNGNPEIILKTKNE